MERPHGVRWRRSLTFAAVASASLLAACGSSDTGGTTTQPSITGKACTPATVSLTPLSAATVECDTGTVVQLAGGGASYIIAANLGTGDSVSTRVSYSLSVNSGGSVVAQIPPQKSAPSLLRVASEINSGRRQPGAFHQQFHQRLRALQHQLVARARARGDLARARLARVARPSLAVSCCPAANSVRHFEVLSAETPTGNKFKSVGARLSYVGSNILLYVDTLAPQPGFSASQLQTFGQQFDQTLYPLDSIFGAPSDIDNNGHVIMLLSPVVNALTTKAQCEQSGFVGGFFFGNDLVNTDTTSNIGEVFYGVVPDPDSTVSCSHTVDEIQSLEGDIFLHELQHLINFGQHVLVSGGFEEEGWVDEGESIVAEEQGSLYYERKFPSPQGRTRNADPTTQLFPDSAEDYIGGILAYMVTYLPRPDTTTVTLRSDDNTDLAWRGGDWLLLRWLGDHYGDAFYTQLEHNLQVGTANIAFTAKSPFSSLFANFAMSLYTDSLPGQPRTAVPLANRFLSRNLRQLSNRLFQTGATQRPWMLPTGQLTATPAQGSLLPGGIALYRLDTSAQATVSVQFSGASAGTPIPGRFVPQLTIFRLPAGS